MHMIKLLKKTSSEDDVAGCLIACPSKNDYRYPKNFRTVKAADLTQNLVLATQAPKFDTQSLESLEGRMPNRSFPSIGQHPVCEFLEDLFVLVRLDCVYSKTQGQGFEDGGVRAVGIRVLVSELLV